MNNGIERLNLTIIVAAARNNVIGKDNTMPWHLSADLKRFRKITTGHPVVMGRKTFESLARPLPERRNIVLSRDPTWAAAGCESINGFAPLYDLVGNQECMVIGGAAVYRQCLPYCRRVYLTQVQAEPDGDVLFPPPDQREWHCEAMGKHPADDDNDYAMVFFKLEKV